MGEHLERNAIVKVYPRVCGVDLTVIGLGVIALGLSPRVRGRCAGDEWRVLQVGFIPACAG